MEVLTVPLARAEHYGAQICAFCGQIIPTDAQPNKDYISYGSIHRLHRECYKKMLCIITKEDIIYNSRRGEE